MFCKVASLNSEIMHTFFFLCFLLVHLKVLIMCYALIGTLYFGLSLQTVDHLRQKKPNGAGDFFVLGRKL